LKSFTNRIENRGVSGDLLPKRDISGFGSKSPETPRTLWFRLRRFRKNETGFTLIEILVALVITVIIIGAIYGAFRAGSRSTVVMEENADLNQTARVLLTRISSELGSLYNISGQTGVSSNIVGQSAAGLGYPPGFDTLTFTTVGHQPLASGEIGGDVCQVTYAAECAADGTPIGLYATENYTPFTQTTIANQTTTNTTIQPSTLVSDLVVGMTLNYLDSSTNQWVSDWVNQTTLPSQVRVEIIVQSPGGKTPPVTATSTITFTSWASTQTGTTTTPTTAAASATPGRNVAGQ